MLPPNHPLIQHYAPIYKDRWPALLAALLAPAKHAALINKHAASQSPSHLPSKLAPLTPLLRALPGVSIPVLILTQPPPSELDPTPITVAFAHPSPSVDTTTPPPSPSELHSRPKPLFDYYLLDPASVLAAEALDVKPSDSVLDLCAAPGGKSIALLQRLNLLHGGSLVANELSDSRRTRLRTVIKQYIPALHIGDSLQITSRDGTKSPDQGIYDKILIDAPCSSDKHFLTSLLHNQTHHHVSPLETKWSPSRLKYNSERQRKLLLSALRSVKPGGTIVYATCSIAPTENDCVIEKVLEKSKVPFDVVRKSGKEPWPFGEPTTYGWMVMPDTCDGYGPLYFATLKRKL